MKKTFKDIEIMKVSIMDGVMGFDPVKDPIPVSAYTFLLQTLEKNLLTKSNGTEINTKLLNEFEDDVINSIMVDYESIYGHYPLNI